MTVALLDERIDAAMRTRLEDMGYTTILMPKHPRLPTATASHPDMLVMKIGRELIVERQYAEENAALFSKISSFLPNLTIKYAEISLTEEYPRDCSLNALLIGNNIFLRQKSVAKEIIYIANRLGTRLVDVRQGYPACSVLALGASHAITADRGMAASLHAKGIEVLLIEDGGISLVPYDYGFIGGASGVHQDKVFFFGDISTHKNGKEIADFCQSCGYLPISLGFGGLVDLGRIIFIDSEDYYDEGK